MSLGISSYAVCLQKTKDKAKKKICNSQMVTYICVSLLNRKGNCRWKILSLSHALSNYEPYFLLIAVFKAFGNVPARAPQWGVQSDSYCRDDDHSNWPQIKRTRGNHLFYKKPHSVWRRNLRTQCYRPMWSISGSPTHHICI